MECYLHPGETAVHVCLACNRPVGDSCKEEFKGEVFCPACSREVRERKEHERVSFTTTNGFEGKRVSKYYGLVTAQVVIALDLLDGLSAAFDLDGGRHRDIELEVRRAKKTAMHELQDRAKKLGANGVVGVQLQVVPLKGNTFLVMLAGTAVEVDELA